MKKFSFRSVLPLICAFSVLVSLAVGSASAADVFPTEYRDIDCVSDWNAKIMNPGAVAMELAVAQYGCSATAESCFWSMVNVRLDGKCRSVSKANLAQWAVEFTDVFNRPYGDWFGSQVVYGTQDVISNSWAKILLGKTDLKFSVRCHESSGLYRIYCDTVGLYVVDSSGKYPFYDPSDGTTDNWIALSTMDNLSIGRHVVDYSQLSAAASSLGIKPSKYGDYWIIKKSGVGTQDWVYADSEGRPYVAPYDKNQTATSTTRPTTSVKDENGDTVEVPENSSSNIDLSGMTVTLPDGTFNFIDQLLYDESTKTYYIDSHDTYTTENNYYVTNNYSWTYHINYTSITYIGQTEEYNKYYEVYYELPDGRDSADLTKEEVEQLNVSVDVIPYGRSADDTSLRSLYHFDGDTRDSSYWNYCTDFTWNKGASLTYMDAGVFNGALYLDETEHDFTLTLPSGIGTQSFTLQFRYYQSYTATPQIDSYIQSGGNVVLRLNGGSFLSSGGDVLASTPVGSWNEVALIRESGILYYYLNGVCIGSISFSTSFSNSFTFHFGAEQQTYKYLDELRVLNYAFTSGGANYDCASVPFDSNLALVLPTDITGIADEYWSWDTSIEPIFARDLSVGWSGLFSANLVSSGMPCLLYDSSSCSYTEEEGFTSLSCDKSFSTSLTSYGTVSVPDSGNLVYSMPSNCFLFPVYISNSAGRGITFDGAVNGSSVGAWEYYESTLTFSIVDTDGNIYSTSFVPCYTSNVLYDAGSFYVFLPKVDTDWGSIRVIYRVGCGLAVAISVNPGVTLNLAYLELVEGLSPNSGHEFVSGVTGIDSDSLDTPTLAVRTDLDITSYQIGGVRPSLPTKGQVWCLVENERITSIQIYNGSAWEGVDGRIWTGERWIPASSYNIITLQDMYDIVDATQDFEYIYSESGFWTWWQKSWNAFTEKLFGVLGTGSGGSSAAGGDGASGLLDVDLDTEDPSADPDEESSKSLWQFIILVISGGKSVVNGTRELFSGVVSTVPDTMETITSALDPGGIAVGALDGTSSDPDAADMPNDPDVVVEDGEVLDPWRYR